MVTPRSRITAAIVHLHSWLCSTLSNAAARPEKQFSSYWEHKDLKRLGGGLQRSAAPFGMFQGREPSALSSPSSPFLQQWLWEGCSPRVCSAHVLQSCNFCSLFFFFLPSFSMLVSPLSTGFLSTWPADVRVDYRAIQLEKPPRNETNNLWNCFLQKKKYISKFWLVFLALEYHPGNYMQLSPASGYSYFLLVCSPDHKFALSRR